jgi:hypothetical protein
MINAVALSQDLALKKALLRFQKSFAAPSRAPYVVLQIWAKPAVQPDIAFNPNR